MDEQNYPYAKSEDAIDRILHRKNKSYLNFILIAVNLIVFVIVEATGGSGDMEHMIRCGAAFTPLITAGEYHRLFTSMFLHFGFGHILSNMLLLFFVGDYLERYLGKIAYAILYLGGGLFAGWFSYRHEIATGANNLSAGASGAVFAVLGGLLVLVVIHRGRLEDLTLPRLLIMIAISLYIGFGDSGVDAYAHLGGFIGGVVLALLLWPLMSRRKQRV